MARTHYETLGVPPTATDVDIKRAYLRLAKTHHPDAGGDGATATFALISAAFDVLKDKSKRASYDMSLSRDVHGGLYSSRGTTPASSASTSGANRSWTRDNRWRGTGANQESTNTFDDDEDWDTNTHWTTEEIERRRAHAAAMSRKRAQDADWWRFEKLAAERRKAEFRAASASSAVKRGERHLSRISHLWLARSGFIWQDIAVFGASTALVAFGAYSMFARGASSASASRTNSPTAHVVDAHHTEHVAPSSTTTPKTP